MPDRVQKVVLWKHNNVTFLTSSTTRHYLSTRFNTSFVDSIITTRLKICKIKINEFNHSIRMLAKSLHLPKKIFFNFSGKTILKGCLCYEGKVLKNMFPLKTTNVALHNNAIFILLQIIWSVVVHWPRTFVISTKPAKPSKIISGGV